MADLHNDPEAERQKEILKDALKEWMDEKFAAFGKWTLGTLVTALLTAVVTFIFWTNGWRPL